jgi:peptide-methionine (S)-S-oxide reductase
MTTSSLQSGSIEQATLGGGCFWCLEAVFNKLRGVVYCEPGYCGGHDPAPTYKSVCSDTTGHAEVVRIHFDPSMISYQDILSVFFAFHDPTTLNRQGHDVGTQYRSVIFYHNKEQLRIAKTYIVQLNAQGEYANPIVTQLTSLKHYFSAEPEHQRYFDLHPTQPYCASVISPKVKALRDQFQSLLA